jgi:hypothetical protein
VINAAARKPERQTTAKQQCIKEDRNRSGIFPALMPQHRKVHFEARNAQTVFRNRNDVYLFMIFFIHSVVLISIEMQENA